MNNALEYARQGRATVEGWFGSLDAKLFIAYDDEQRRLNQTGDIVEIGAYMGRSAILLGYLAREGEEVIVIDLFGADAHHLEQEAEKARWYGGLTRTRFEENYARFHPSPCRILQGSSRAMLAAIPSGSCRFIHIDGSHEFEAVRADIREAIRIATPDGVIVLDDILSQHTPGVSASAWEAVLGGQLVPLVQTTKLYACLPGSGRTSSDLANSLKSIGVEIIESHVVLGNPILEVAEIADPEPHPPQRRLSRVAHSLLPPVAVQLWRRKVRPVVRGSTRQTTN